MTSFLKRRLLSLALGVSVTFNLAVLVGFMIGGGPGWGPFGGPFGGPPGGPPGPKSPLGPALDLDRAAHVLALTEEQRGKLAEIKNDRDRIFPAIDEQAQLLDHDLHDELAKEQADSATVRQILERQAQLSTERRMAQADLFERFQQVLTVEQRHRLHEELSKRPPREPPPPEAVRRFDANGDGRLERSARPARRCPTGIRERPAAALALFRPRRGRPAERRGTGRTRRVRPDPPSEPGVFARRAGRRSAGKSSLSPPKTPRPPPGCDDACSPRPSP